MVMDLEDHLYVRNSEKQKVLCSKVLQKVVLWIKLEGGTALHYCTLDVVSNCCKKIITMIIKCTIEIWILHQQGILRNRFNY